MDKKQNPDAAKAVKVQPREWDVIELPDGSILHRNLIHPEKTYTDKHGD